MTAIDDAANGARIVLAFDAPTLAEPGVLPVLTEAFLYSTFPQDWVPAKPRNPATMF